MERFEEVSQVLQCGSMVCTGIAVPLPRDFMKHCFLVCLRMLLSPLYVFFEENGQEHINRFSSRCCLFLSNGGGILSMHTGTKSAK